VKLEAIELIRVLMPLVEPFRTSFGVQNDRDVLLVRVVSEQGEGWGEFVAPAEPRYSSEFVDAAESVIRRFIAPALLARPELSAARVTPLVDWIRGHPMAKGAVEMAVLDAELRAAEVPLLLHPLAGLAGAHGKGSETSPKTEGQAKRGNRGVGHTSRHRTGPRRIAGSDSIHVSEVSSVSRPHGWTCGSNTSCGYFCKRPSESGRRIKRLCGQPLHALLWIVGRRGVWCTQ